MPETQTQYGQGCSQYQDPAGAGGFLKALSWGPEVSDLVYVNDPSCTFSNNGKSFRDLSDTSGFGILGPVETYDNAEAFFRLDVPSITLSLLKEVV